VDKINELQLCDGQLKMQNVYDHTLTCCIRNQTAVPADVLRKNVLYT